jgi:hypothetical protein
VNRVELLRWAAWAPGLATQEEWLAWARAPQPPSGGGAPEVRFLPALQRRRCDALSRTMLEVAHACCPEPLLAEVACVFATRYGPLATMVGLLRDLATLSALSPARFTHSVHNAPAGLFSIWARNPQPSSSLAAGAETFACGFLEAVATLHREAGRQVLFVVADELVPEPFGALAERLDGAYAVALLLGAGDGEGSLQFRLEQARGPAPSSAWPDALEFLRWWIAGEPKLCLTRGPRTWVWTRHV